jgi:phytoene dehydrogenase-like protein
MGAMDYYFHGTGHVRGGVGVLARELTRAIGALGGEVLLANRVKAIRRDGDGWAVETRRGVLRARSVVANVLPQALRGLLGWGVGEDARLDRLAARVEAGWGAAMLYRVVRAPVGAPASASHFELVADPTKPFTEGNHVFMSLSGAGERESEGLRTATLSTHVPLGQDGASIARVQETMRQTVAALAPEWTDVTFEETASPRTYERFTGRPGGAVGGIPRRAGLSHYEELGPRPVQGGLYLVGDSVFPGQSTLAAALGGVRLAVRLQRERR